MWFLDTNHSMEWIWWDLINFINVTFQWTCSHCLVGFNFQLLRLLVPTMSWWNLILPAGTFHLSNRVLLHVFILAFIFCQICRKATIWPNNTSLPLNFLLMTKSFKTGRGILLPPFYTSICYLSTPSPSLYHNEF